MAKKTTSAKVETFEFRAEARQLLKLIVHSVYSDKDVFLRELIANASDALDKLRLATFQDKDLDVDTSDLHIAIERDEEQRTLTVRDNGIGMSRDEVVDLIGTIARSGTTEFLERLADLRDKPDLPGLIGQFGVGFYASFMVADKVSVMTRKAGEDTATRWESDGEGTYTLETIDDAPQGTAVTLHLKPVDAEDHLFDYTAEWKIIEVVKRFSDFITWPIRMSVERQGAGDDDSDDEEAVTSEVETLNSMKALWARAKDEVSDEEYAEFYRQVSRDWQEPLETIRMHAEGAFEYQALLFIPSHPPLDLFTPGGRRGLQLYVRRVHVMDDCEALMPEYLRFVRGVVDAQDLSLNVSREVLQRDRQIHVMRRRLVKKVLSAVSDMPAADPDRYRRFWNAFGRVMKEGLLSDFENRDTILELASFASTHDADETTTLRQYVERMKDGQERIYYVTGESRSIVESSPHLEAFRDKGFEVLLLTDPIDEMWVGSVPEFDGKRLQSVTQGALDLGADDGVEKTDDTQAQESATEDEGESPAEKQEDDFDGLLSWLGTTLADTVKEVRLSTRLTTSPACLVGDMNGLTPTLEKMYRAMGQPIPPVKRTLELNPSHPVVSALRQAHTAGDGDDAGMAEAAELLYGVALLAEGGELSDPARFSRLVADRMARTI